METATEEKQRAERRERLGSVKKGRKHSGVRVGARTPPREKVLQATFRLKHLKSHVSDRFSRPRPTTVLTENSIDVHSFPSHSVKMRTAKKKRNVRTCRGDIREGCSRERKPFLSEKQARTIFAGRRSGGSTFFRAKSAGKPLRLYDCK